MRKIREILRLCWDERLSRRKVGLSCNISASTVGECVYRAQGAGLTWPLPEDLDDEELERLLYPPSSSVKVRPEPDFPQVFRELRRKGVTRLLLWQEYKQNHPDGYEYSQFCDRYRAWVKPVDLVMHQEHRAGEKLFVDFAGQTLPMIDRQTGEIIELQIFVATLGASNFTYAEAVPSQELRWWLQAHINAFEYCGGVAEVTVPDNLKSGVKKPNYYEPDINPAYQELAEYYDTIVIPARVRKPRDKAKVENGVLQVERWVLAPLRNQEFFSLEEANEAIRERLEWLNNRPFSRIEGSRRSLWSELDKPALKPLPLKRFEIATWKTNAGVNIDHHVEFDKRYYSVPYTLVGKKVDIRATATTIECLHNRRRVASHRRSYDRYGTYVTVPAHRPKSHQRYAEWTPSRIINWALKTGPATSEIVRKVIEEKPHPEQGFRACLGIIRLGDRYGKERLEAACRRARAIRSHSYKSIQSILKTGFDKRPLPEVEPQPTQATLPFDHEHLRGSDGFS